MTQSRSKFESGLLKSIRVCIANCDRLLDETYDLEFRKPPPTRMYLSMIAQEEAAKAFILYLVKEDIMPFTSANRRTIKDHTSKQLVGVLMDCMVMHWDDIAELHADLDCDDDLPGVARSAVELLCYEKVRRWMGHDWIWSEEPGYDKLVQKLADGHADRRKQSAIYVNIGSTGQVSSTPNLITETETIVELDKASRYSGFVERLVDIDPSASGTGFGLGR